MFSFAFVSAEDLILQKLPEKATERGLEPMSGTHGLAQLLKNNPDVLTLDWVLEILEEEIKKYPDQPILVDLIPNLKFMMRVDGFIKKCDKEMEKFEKRVSVELLCNDTIFHVILGKLSEPTAQGTRGHSSFRHLHFKLVNSSSKICMGVAHK